MMSAGSLVRLICLISAVLVIFWLSITPHPPVPQTGVLSWDKVQHALAYAVLTLIAGWALLPLVSPPVRAWRWGLVFTLCYGGLIEILQARLTSARSGEIADMLANSIGGLAAYGLVRLISMQRQNPKDTHG